MGNKRKRSRRHGILAGRTPRAGQCVPKLLGADVEVGNFLAGVARPGGTGSEASRALLREFDGVPAKRWQPAPSPDPRVASGGRSWDGSHATGPADHLADDVPTADHAASREAVGTSSHTWDNSYRSYSGYSTAYPAASSSDLQDQGRTFLPGNGGCAYIDLDHLEFALPETRSAFDHVACWHAMLRLTRQAMETANHGARARGERVAVLVNNSDGLGHSYGGHLNLLSRDGRGTTSSAGGCNTSSTSRRSRPRPSSSLDRARSAARTAAPRHRSSSRSAPTSSRRSSGRRRPTTGRW